MICRGAVMRLVRAGINDCGRIWSMQTAAFRELLEKYRDYETSPGNETMERIEAKLRDVNTYFYYIYLDDDAVGAVRVVDRKDGSKKRIAPIFIMKEFRGRGLAQQAIAEAERIHGSDNWKLDTILQEDGLCRLYEKIGYRKTGEVERINERMDIVYYEK
jgi:GNAT superfamily N-acetyltransferase